MDIFELRQLGFVSSTLTDCDDAPRQSDEGAPPAWLVFDPDVLPALDGVQPGSQLVVLTWLHRADRQALVVHPRGGLDRPPTGVFVTRSPDRPNPIGLHTVRVLAVEGPRVRVDHLEAIDGTPIVDVKAILSPVHER